jgi:DNA polymerase-3 subunit gamma/tau
VSLALYRKYRPQTFAELVGQEHVTDALQNALRNDRVHHAYLFSGPRGCGKTSSARILARSLNCEKGPTPDPCGTCDQCTSISNGSSLDVVEIDAASHGGVDDARDLRERAFFSPVSSRFKVYVVDEAHMVSREGFNALLKLVEEPPDFLKFVFATTEPEKVIATIRSRTHHYPFRLVPPKILTSHLQSVCEQEGVQIDPRALPLVVRAGGGSVRDALSVLDQLLAGADDGGISYDLARGLLGVTDGALLDEIVDAFAARDGAAVFATIAAVVDAGHDPRRFASDLLDRFKDLVVIQRAPDAVDRGILDCSPDMVPRLQQQASSMGAAEVSRAAEVLYAGLTEMRGTTSPRLVLELVCGRILLPAAATDEQAVLARLDRLERRLDITGDGIAEGTVRGAGPVRTAPAPREAVAPSPAPTVAPTPPAASAPPPGAWPADEAPAERPLHAVPDSEDVPAPAPAPVEAPAAAAPPPAPGGLDAAAVRRVWPEIVNAVPRKTTKALLVDAQVTRVDGSTLTLEFPRPWGAQKFSEGVNAEMVREALASVLGVEWKVKAVVRGDAGDGGAVAAATPAPAAPPSIVDEAADISEDDEPVGASGGAGGGSAGDDPVALLKSGLGATVISETKPD